MASYIHCLLDEMYQLENKEEIQYLFRRFYTKDGLRELAHKDFIDWVKQQFDEAELPKGALRNVLVGEFIFNSERVEEFLTMIKENFENTEFD